MLLLLLQLAICGPVYHRALAVMCPWASTGDTVDASTVLPCCFFLCSQAEHSSHAQSEPLTKDNADLHRDVTDASKSTVCEREADLAGVDKAGLCTQQP